MLSCIGGGADALTALFLVTWHFHECSHVPSRIGDGTDAVFVAIWHFLECSYVLSRIGGGAVAVPLLRGGGGEMSGQVPMER